METFTELYYREPYTREFDAQVVACTQAANGFEIALDETAFYPLGGGQLGDRGTLTEGDLVVHVRDTVRTDDVVLHLCDQPLPVGSRVHGSLDWTWRLDNMEAHTGEHVVSGIVHGLFGYNNVGFHMGQRCVEVDFDGVITEEQALDVEQRANAAVRQNIPITAWLPSPEELRTMDFRSKREIDGPVRVVSIAGVDTCACCGTHLATTGEVGLIKIVRVTTKKSRTRLELLCGRRALLAVENTQAWLRAVSNFLSVGDDEAAEAVSRLAAERDSYKHELKQATHQLINQRVAALEPGTSVLVFQERGLDAEARRYLCERVVETGVARICAVFAPSAAAAPAKKAETDAAARPPRSDYVIAANGPDLRPACKELNGRLNGRGGGKPQMVQGSFAATSEEIAAALHEVLGPLLT